MMTLKVPYNFVPLNEKVVRPYWIDHISHDVPFKDGKSGTIKLTLTAESPIFVRRGEAKPPKDNNEKTKEQKEPYEFEKDACGNYFLPGSSLRGMVRSVVETLSFGRMIGRVSERRYALRDLSNKRLYTEKFQVDPRDKKPIRGGWLRYDKQADKYTLQDIGVPGRVDFAYIKVKGKVTNSQGGARNIDHQEKGKKKDDKAAERKYELFSDKFVEQTYDFLLETVDHGREIYAFAPEQYGGNAKSGEIVMTGQPSSSKRLEFIFWKQEIKREIPVSSELVENFKFAYFDDNANQQSDDYKWRKSQLEKGKTIPVFFKPTDVSDGSALGVEHFGLSYLYKLPYDNTVEDSIRNHQNKGDAEKCDLADAIFGMVGTSERKSELDFLKGRVQFSHAKMITGNQQTKEERVILGEPRASFYPTYMQQNVRKDGTTGRYNTFMDDEPIAGRKRYPVLDDGTRKTNFEGIKSDSPLITKFLPLEKGTTFTCDLHYHNLRPVELGALLSALTFHGTEKSRHQVGMAKPLGFGKVKLDVAGLTDKEQADLMLRYESFMDVMLETKEGWRNSPQVKEIVALTTPVKPSRIEALEGDFPYNSLNEFRQVKNGNEALRRHSSMRNGNDLTIGLNNDASRKQTLEAEIRKDRDMFLEKGPDEKTIRKKILKDIEEKINKRIDALAQQGKDLTRQIELSRKAQIEERRKAETEQKEATAKSDRSEAALRAAQQALEAGPNYVNVLMGRPRDYWKKLNELVTDYLVGIQPVYNNPSDDARIPEQWRSGLKEKIVEVNQRQKKDWKKNLAAKKADAIVWLGEEATEHLFRALE